MFSSSPKLIAAFHVFHRHLTPRHPPFALSSLATIVTNKFKRFDANILFSQDLQLFCRCRFLSNIQLPPVQQPDLAVYFNQLPLQAADNDIYYNKLSKNIEGLILQNWPVMLFKALFFFP